jgi:hypothetical protein
VFLLLSNTLRPSLWRSYHHSAIPNFGIYMHSHQHLNLAIGLKLWAHSDPRLPSWSLCVGHSTSAFQATKSAKLRHRRTRRRDGTSRRMTRFMDREDQSSRKFQARKIQAEREGLGTLRRVHRAAKERNVVRGRSTVMRMHTGVANSIVQH